MLLMKFLKLASCVHKGRSTDLIYGELSEYPVQISFNVRIIRNWIRLIIGKTKKIK